jgi:hypothetical protein
MHLFDDGRDYRDEADRIIETLESSGVWPGAKQFTAKDISFVRDIKRRAPGRVTEKQVFWLRDIQMKALEADS